MRRTFFLAILTYGIGICLAVTFKIELFENIENSTNNLVNPINEIIGMHKEDLLIRIMKNNIFVIFLNIFGCFSFGGITFLNTFYNGFILGLLLKTLSLHLQFNEILPHILPHSLELVAIIISCSIGYRYSEKLYHNLFNEQKISIKRNEIFLVLISSLFIVFSAFMETYVSINN